MLPSVAVAAATAAEDRAPHRHAREERDRQRDRRRDRADEDVAVAHVRDLVGEHAAQLVLVDDLQEALRDGDRRVVLGLRPVAKALGCAAGADVDRGHRHVGPLGEVADDRVELRRFLLGDRLGAGGRHRELVGEPVRAADEDEAEDAAR